MTSVPLIERPTVFDRAYSIDFADFPPEWARGLRNLVLYVRATDGLPSLRTRHHGMKVGEWLSVQQRRVGRLTVAQRTCLLAVPGVVLATHRTSASLGDQVEVSDSRRALWHRLIHWAVAEHNGQAQQKGRDA